MCLLLILVSNAFVKIVCLHCRLLAGRIVKLGLCVEDILIELIDHDIVCKPQTLTVHIV